MRCQQTYSLPTKAGRRPRAVILAALGTLLTANAVSQNQPTAPATPPAQKPTTTPTNQTKRPAANPGAEAKQPVAPTPTAAKPSVLDKTRSFFGMKKSSSDTNKSDQSHSFLDYFRSHGNNADKSTPNTRAATTNAGRTPSNQPAKSVPQNLSAAGGGTRPAVPIGHE